VVAITGNGAEDALKWLKSNYKIKILSIVNTRRKCGDPAPKFFHVVGER